MVEFKAEMPLLVLIANTAHPLDDRAGWQCSTLEVLAWAGEPTAPADELWSSTPERQRAFENTSEEMAAHVPH
jgi:uncharacterized protein YcgI (DUF1989 family)